jgi:hypothetical protein
MDNNSTCQSTKSIPDWERIETDYRSGILSLREIAAKDGNVNHVAIKRRAEKLGWTRDLAQKIRSKAADLVTRATVTGDVTAKAAVTEREAVEAGAEAIARARMAHRSDISRGRALAISLLTELEAETSDIDLFRQLGDMLRNEDRNGQDKRNDLYQKIISSAGRIDSMKKLSDTFKTLIALDREAYGITAVQVDTNSRAPSGLGHFYGEPDL